MIYSISMKTQHLYFRYILKMELSIKILFSSDNCSLHSLSKDIFVLIDWQYALFKSTWSKTSYLTPYYVPHEWFVFLHRVLLAYWVDYIFPTSKCRHVFSISKYSNIKSLKMWTILELVAAVSWKVFIGPVYEPLLHFVCTWHLHKN